MNSQRSSAETYRTVGDPLSADVIVGFSFDQSRDRESFIDQQLGSFAIDIAKSHSIPVIGDPGFIKSIPLIQRIRPKGIVAAGPKLDIQEVGIEVDNTLSRNLDIHTTLRGAKDYLETNHLTSPILVAHAREVGRVAAEAERMGLGNVIVPPGLPNGFDGHATEPSRRSKFRWVMRGIVNRMLLRRP